MSSEKKPHIRPLGGRVVIRRDSPEKKSTGGIILPDSAQRPAAEGVVVAVGKGRVLANGLRVESELRPGDRVLFGKYVGGQVSRSSSYDEDIVIVDEQDDVLAVLT